MNISSSLSAAPAVAASISDPPDLVEAKKKIVNIIAYDDLPKDVKAPLWDKIEECAQLSLDELGALQNARCHQSSGWIVPFKFPEASDDLAPSYGIGALLLPRQKLIEFTCDMLMKETQSEDGRAGTVSRYWRGPKGSGKTTFLQLLGKELQHRDCAVFYAYSASVLNDADTAFVDLLYNNRSAFADTVVIIIDEVPSGVNHALWVRLLKHCKGVIVLGAGVPLLRVDSPARFDITYPSNELHIGYHFDDELDELSLVLQTHFPENTRTELTSFCEYIYNFTGGHIFPLLRLCVHFLQTPNGLADYKWLLRSSLVETEAYQDIVGRCYDFYPSDMNAFVRLLRQNPNAEDEDAYEKHGLWDIESQQFVSNLYLNHLLNFNPPTDKAQNALCKGNKIFRRDAVPKLPFSHREFSTSTHRPMLRVLPAGGIRNTALRLLRYLR